MAQTLEYNKNVTAVVPVTIPTFDDDLKIIQALDDEPNDVGGMTAAELKAKFDEGNITAQQYINDVLIPAVVADDMTEQSRQAAESERVANEIERVSNEEARVTAEADREKEIAKVENLTVSSEALEYGEPASAEVTTNPETGGLNVHFGLPMGKDGLSYLPVIEGDDVPDGVEAWIDPSIESYQGGGGGGDGKPEVHIGPDEPTNGEAIWINPDEEEGSFLTKEETEALVDGKIAAIPEGMQMELLWENASTYSSFSPQTVTFEETDCYFYLIEWKWKNTNNVTNGATFFEFMKVGAESCLEFYDPTTDFSALIVGRYIPGSTKSSITFNDGKTCATGSAASSSTKNNDYVIPVKIYGIKGVQ